MKKHYDIYQIVTIGSAVEFLADKLNIPYEELAERAGATIVELRRLYQYCEIKGYAVETIMARRLNDIAREEGLNVRFGPGQITKIPFIEQNRQKWIRRWVLNPGRSL